jgi:hypothetical protein
VATTRRAHPSQKWFGLTLSAAAVGWTVFVLATHGPAEDRYFRNCTGSCLAQMPDSDRLKHDLLAAVLIVVPIAVAAGAWIFLRWLLSTSDD